MEEDTVELRMAKLASEFYYMAEMGRREAAEIKEKANVYEECAKRIQTELQKAPVPIDTTHDEKREKR